MHHTNEENPLLPEKNVATHATWKGTSLSKQLNVVGTITCILDTAINLTASRSKKMASFFSDTVPIYISATYYILPSASLLGIYLKNLFFDKCMGQPQPEEDANEKAERLIAELNDVDGFAQFLEDHPTARESLLNKINDMQKNGYIDKINFFINILYFTLRAMQGGLLIFKEYGLSDKKTNESITDWADFASSVVNVTYLMTMLIHNHCHHRLSENKHILFSTKPSQPSLTVNAEKIEIKHG